MKLNTIFLFLWILLVVPFVWAQEKPKIVVNKTDNLSCNDLEVFGSLQAPTPRINALTHVDIQFRDFQMEPGANVRSEAEENPLLFNLDGNMSDWENQEPLWSEAGIEGRGPFENSIDIKRVFFKNDDKFLFVFMQLSPTIEERFKISESGDVVGYLYLDTDNDPETGSSGVVKYEGFTEDRYRGYDVKVFLPVGIMSSSKGKTPYVGYEIRSLDNGEFSVMSGFKQNSFSRGALIAHGKDGIEFALPLDKLGLQPPETIRILLAEQAHFSKKEGYTIGLIDLE